MSFSDLTFYCRLSVLSACHSSKCEVLRHPFRSFDPLSPSFVPRYRSATLNLQTYQPQKFLHLCNSFCILLQTSRYPCTGPLFSERLDCFYLSQTSVLMMT